jgi:hypothetical protein
MLRESELTIYEQMEFLDRLVARCAMRDGKLADETTLTLTAQEAHDLHHLSIRLQRLSPFESQIRKLVTGRG